MNEIRTNENKGFSLVELIVVIAIMAVMAAVLAPSLLGYVERSRAQKDDSAMGELTNSIKLALADQDVFDECLAYTAKFNYSCYVDDAEARDLTTAKGAVITKAADNVGGAKTDVQFTYDDSTRKLDETEYTLAGNMRGLTVTFSTKTGSDAVNNTNKAVYDLALGKVNTYAAAPTGASAPKTVDFGKMDSSGTAASSNTGKLYNRVRATVGDKIELSSQTYRNSNYTVFICMGSTGGNQATAQDAIRVYGQWNGTNLSEAKAASAAAKTANAKCGKTTE
jgi:type IV pilus assembly protein PilA